MKIDLPEGKRVAVNFGADFDAQCCWMGTFGKTSPSFMSRGDFDVEVGVPRVLSTFKRYGVRGNFFTPTHTMLTYPDRFREVVESGHEIGAHGCWHEPLLTLSADEERRLMELQIAQHLECVGRRPRGYRSPSWDFTDSTLALLQEFEFEWDSSLMGRDFEPYRPRPLTIHYEEATQFEEPSSVVEFPVSWFLDDIVTVDFIPGVSEGLCSMDTLFQRWKDHFDFCRDRIPSGLVTYTVHPQSIGRAHALMMLARLLEYMTSFDDVWFASLSDIFERTCE